MGNGTIRIFERHDDTMESAAAKTMACRRTEAEKDVMELARSRGL